MHDSMSMYTAEDLDKRSLKVLIECDCGWNRITEIPKEDLFEGGSEHILKLLHIEANTHLNDPDLYPDRGFYETLEDHEPRREPIDIYRYLMTPPTFRYLSMAIQNLKKADISA